MFLCEPLRQKGKELGFEGEIWLFQENEDDPFRIVVAVCDTHWSRLAGGTHIGLIGDAEDQWRDTDAAIAQTAIKARNMREKIILNHLHTRHDVDGMKAAIICTRELECGERERAFAFLGTVAATMSDGLGKTCLVGGDAGTSPEDLLDAWHVAPRHIVGRPREDGGVGDTGMPTALGVADTINLICKIYGDNIWPKTASILGLGKVGRVLAIVLAKGGWNLRLSDINCSLLYADLTADLVAAHRAETDRFFTFHFVAHTAGHREAATVFAPCALHPIIRADTIGEFSSHLKAIISAQNDEIDPTCAFELAYALHDRGIVYVPGPAANPMGIQMLLREHDLGRMPYEEIFTEERVFHIGAVQSLLLQAKDEGSPPYAIAMERIATALNQ